MQQPQKEQLIYTGARLSRATLERLEAFRQTLAEGREGGRISQGDVFRIVVERGLAAVETPPPPTATAKRLRR